MTVDDLIEILKTMPPQATVVVPAYQDRSDVIVALSLTPKDVQAVKMVKPLISSNCNFRPRPDTYELSKNGKHSGVVLGYLPDDAPKHMPKRKVLGREDLF